MSPVQNATTPAAGLRRFGRFELRELLGRSSRSMLWLASEPGGPALALLLPRQAAADAALLADSERALAHACRLDHPQLVAPAAAGVEERWPFVAWAREQGDTLDARLAADGLPSPAQAAQWLCDLLQGLAFAHESGLAHGDIGGHTVWIDAAGRARLAGLGIAAPVPAAASAGGGALAVDAVALRAQRAAAERDLLACGLLLHRLLSGRHALDEPDVPTALQRLPRDTVRLGWSTPQPLPDALRTITDRATEGEPERRYLGARSLQRALQGWLDAQAGGEDGVLVLLLDKLHASGHLPARPGLTPRIAAIASVEHQRLHEMTEVILQDPALAFELLRQVNAVQFAAHGEGGVLTVRRAMQLIGVQGLRRAAAGLRPWPGALDAGAAVALASVTHDALLAAGVARLLCPADMDGEHAFLIALLQQLGTLLLHYHFAEEARQIDALIAPADPAVRPMEPAAAAMAVLGVDVEALGAAVARHWGLHESLLHAMRPVPTNAPVRAPDQRDETLRLLAGAGVETAAAARRARTPKELAQGLSRVEQRYLRPLVLAPQELKLALQRTQEALAQTLSAEGVAA